MKRIHFNNKIHICFTLLLGTLVVIASASTAVAQKLGGGKKGGKKVTSSRGPKGPKIPKAGLGAAAERQIIAELDFAQRTKLINAALQGDRTPVASSLPKVDLPKVSEEFSLPMQMDVIGLQELNKYHPDWYENLSLEFHYKPMPEQLIEYWDMRARIEYAIKETDELIFVRAENGELALRNPEEWNYEKALRKHYEICLPGGSYFFDNTGLMYSFARYQTFRAFYLAKGVFFPRTQGRNVSPAEKEFGERLIGNMNEKDYFAQEIKKVYDALVKAEKEKKRNARQAYNQRRKLKQEGQRRLEQEQKQAAQQQRDAQAEQLAIKTEEMLANGDKKFSFNNQDQEITALRQEIDAIIAVKGASTPGVTRLINAKKQWVKQWMETSLATPEQILRETEYFIAQYDRFPGEENSFEEKALLRAVNQAIKKADNPKDPVIKKLAELKIKWTEFPFTPTQMKIFDDAYRSSVEEDYLEETSY